jgi:integrase/recombinase XerD
VTAGRVFTSSLAIHLRAYLDLRLHLGATSFAKAHYAKELDDYLTFHGVGSVQRIDEGLVVNWLHSLPRQAPATKNAKLAFARGFLSYLVRVGMLKDNPALRIPYLKQKTYKPHIYTIQEIQRLLEEARENQRRYPNRLTGWTMETIIFLLYACGLRLSEALNLRMRDVDFEETVLSLWKTKFHKERLVPFSPAVGAKLRSYLVRRRKSYPAVGLDAPFFCHARGKYKINSIEGCFRVLLVRCGMAKPTGRGVPRLHDFRHSMAVHRLYKWYQEGHDILNKLPLLSTYMGHVNIENTQVYLTITRALLREGDRRFQDAFEQVTEKTISRTLGKP